MNEQNASAESSDSAAIVPVAQIAAEGNYRRRAADFADPGFEQSIRDSGLLQPVLVRPWRDAKNDSVRYKLVAGFRRLQAVAKVFGPEATIPVLVRQMSEAEAVSAMLAENMERKNTSAIEDAEGATTMVGLCNGDRDEAARRLGWNRQLLDRRLAIMNAAEPVRSAYLDDKINLGHVEVLAALRIEVQAKVLPALLAAATLPTVAELKAMAEASLLNLDSAIFDRAECQGCRFNTGQQQAMFDHSFEGNRCTNRLCYEGKTNLELERRRAALEAEYQVVRIVRPGDNSTVTPLKPEAVGEKQAVACKACGNFGACVSAVPDKLGREYKNVCFDATCHAEKKAAFAAATAKPKVAKAVTGAATEATAKLTPNAGSAAAETVSEQAAAQAPGAEAEEPAATPGTIRNAVREYREGVWRATLPRALAKAAPEVNRAVLVALLLHRPSDIDSGAIGSAIGKALERESTRPLSLAEALETALALDRAQLGKALQCLPMLSVTASITDVVAVLQAVGTDIAHHWKLSKSFLEVLTKSEIESVAIEIGLADACGDKHWKALKAGSKKDLVEKLLAVEGFQYIGAIPALMRW